MTVTSSNAFKPIKVGRMELGHRIVMAPLTRLRADKETHTLPKMAEEYYEQRASRPGTLIITEATFMAERAGGYPSAPGIYSEEQVAQWKKVFEKIHAKGSYVYVQLWHLGRLAPERVMGKGNVVSASDVPFDGSQMPGEYYAPNNVPRPLTVDEIQQYVKDYAAVAKMAVEAGADGVEIHDANSYLLDQFLHENTNLRTDEYGGSIEKRARFTLEVVDAVSEAIGADRTAIRFSPWGTVGGVDYGVSPIPQWSYLAAQLEKRRREGKELAYIHLVEPRVAGYMDLELPEDQSNDFFRLIYGGILIRAGGLADRKLIDDITSKEDKTLIALGRYFISNPDIVNRLEKGIPLTKYDRDTFYSQGPEGYIDYSFAQA
uniref:ARAD1D22462p n=1 Tax=Blastobotrys adeninivorans TaxID=409370 RepID=A0A060TAB1_BLAAD